MVSVTPEFMVSVLVADIAPAVQVNELHDRLSVTVIDAFTAIITSSFTPGITPPDQEAVEFQLPPAAEEVIVAAFVFIVKSVIKRQTRQATRLTQFTALKGRKKNIPVIYLITLLSSFKIESRN